MTTLPPIDELLARAHVVSLPMRVRFRGVDAREASAPRGALGLGRVRPLRRVRRRRVGALARCRDRGRVCRCGRLPCATSSPSTRPSPPSAPERVPDGAGPLRRVHDGEGQGRRARADARRRRRPGRRRPVRDGAGRARPGRRQRRLGPRRRPPRRSGGSRHTTSSTPSSPAPRSRSSPSCELRLARNGIDVPIAADESIRKAEDPHPGGRGSARLTSSSSRWRRSVGCRARSRSSRRAACLRSCRRRSTRASGSRPVWRSRPRCPRSTTPAAWAPSASSTATSRRRRGARRVGC